jgi:hypothetical protein
MNKTHILITLLWMYIPRNWEFGSALQNFEISGWVVEPPSLGTPLICQTLRMCSCCVCSIETCSGKTLGAQQYSSDLNFGTQTVRYSTCVCNVLERDVAHLLWVCGNTRKCNRNWHVQYILRCYQFHTKIIFSRNYFRFVCFNLPVFIILGVTTSATSWHLNLTRSLR